MDPWLYFFYGGMFSDAFMKATTLDAMQNGFRPMVSLQGQMRLRGGD
jgi:hypothetical protein